MRRAAVCSCCLETGIDVIFTLTNHDLVDIMEKNEFQEEFYVTGGCNGE